MTAQPMAKYEGVRERLVTSIRDLRPHAPLPSERELGKMFGVSRETVHAAIEGLIDEGLVYRIHGSGTYVAEAVNVSKSVRLSSFSDDMRDRGLVPSARVIHAEEVAADAKLARDLVLSPGDPVVLVHRVRLADNVPMALERVYLVGRLVPGLLEHDLAGSLYDLLQETYGLELVRAVQRIRATVVQADEARLLEVPAFSPALHVSRITVDRRGMPVESTESFYRADRYTFTMNIARDSSSSRRRR